jgi:hypothetical protein
MVVAYNDIKTDVLELLSKDNTYQGFYTDSKISFAINDSLDYVFANMMFNGEGWLTTTTTLNTVANTETVALPTGCVVVHQVWYKVGDTWVPLTYDTNVDKTQFTTTTQVPYPVSFSVEGVNLFFNPVPSNVGTGTIRIKYSAFPALLAANASTDAQITRGLRRFVAYRSASVCLTTTDNSQSPWKEYEIQWWQYLQDLLSKRVKSPQFIQSFRN